MKSKVLYLTFDDGPIPEVTPFVMQQLAAYQAKATFFCVGENLARNASLARQLVQEGHTLGNHTHQHVKAWQTPLDTYLQQVQRCEQLLAAEGARRPGKPLFRPPHGQLTPQLLRKLNPTHQVVMWDALSYDFDATLAPERCLQKTIATTKPGSIIVMHDSLKAERNVRYVLPRYLEHFTALGYRFESL